MSNVFMNFENSKTSDHHRILINLSDKMNLKRSDTLRSLIDVGCGIEGERGGGTNIKNYESRSKKKIFV